MRLVYKGTDRTVQIGDHQRLQDGTEVKVVGITEPHKPASTGRVLVEPSEEWRGKGGGTTVAEFFPAVIGAEWIDREDH